MPARISQRPLTGGVVLLMLVAFFGVVIGVNVTMMQLAIATIPGTEVDSAYRASLGYEKEILAARDQDARKWKVDAQIQRDAEGAAVLQVEARGKADRPITGLTFAARLERPTDKRADLAVTLKEIGNGIYRARFDGIAPGQWDLVLEGGQTGQRMFLSKNRVLLN
ncbi:FixH family protein [Bradyrhizobium sp. CB3481]|uniref:FixH family protein n=1 Tax=Bradyrhizobium sp. CB3481 TaxID=3039158 RepID=UPI0024B18F59|nr:FixH family protein [Bradyrhizobium sp. CB3481]WFU14818.1 FixH family protein [Bradyrhizobium sp. CB3481]